jgi:hypothetical protein
LDAYVFASSANGTAVSTLAAGVGNGGPARVVLPLSGDRAVYVAVEAASENSLEDKIDEVKDTSGISGATAYIVDAGEFDDVAFPTHAVVLAYVGFALLQSNAPATLAGVVSSMTGVSGVAVVENGSAKVLVEVTASTSTSLTTYLNAVVAAQGVTAVTFTATGQRSNGTGFPV